SGNVLERLEPLRAGELKFGFRISRLLQHLDRETQSGREIPRGHGDARAGARNAAASTPTAAASTTAAATASTTAADGDVRVQLAHLILQLLARVALRTA